MLGGIFNFGSAAPPLNRELARRPIDVEDSDRGTVGPFRVVRDGYRYLPWLIRGVLRQPPSFAA